MLTIVLFVLMKNANLNNVENAKYRLIINSLLVKNELKIKMPSKKKN